MSESNSKSFPTNMKPDQPGISLQNEIGTECQKMLDQAVIKINHCAQQLNEQQIWWRPQKALNSIGNLILHISGNLRQWAIAGVGRHPDNRNRQSEFDQREPLAAAELLDLVHSTVSEAKKVIRQIPPNQWTQRIEIQGFSVSNLEAILHTVSHFVGHTHQIIMLTRIQLGDAYQFDWSPDSGGGSVPI